MCSYYDNNMDKKMNERRNESRYVTQWPVFLRSNGESKQIGDVADISLSGIKIILSDHVVIAKESGSFDLFLFNTHSPSNLLNITGHTVWHTESDHSLAIGLKLEDFDSSTRTILSDFIMNQEELNVQMDLEFV